MARNLLLGQGHVLTKKFDFRPGGRGKQKHPHTFPEARLRLAPRVTSVEQRVRSLPVDACPGGQAVLSVTLNPEYLAKSHLPHALASAVGANLIGSRGRVLPGFDEPCPELLYAAPINRLQSIVQYVNGISDGTTEAHDFRKIEDVRIEGSGDKVKFTGPQKTYAWEVLLHASANPRDAYIIKDFIAFCAARSIRVDADRIIHAGGLTFLPAFADPHAIEELEDFQFFRYARIMPRLRRAKVELGGMDTIECEVSQFEPHDRNARILVMDGGRPASPFLDRYVNDFDYPGIGVPVSVYQDHCLGVLSAVLFGPCKAGRLPRPVCKVDSVRIFDERSWSDPTLEYFDVLVRVRTLLQDGGDKYDFACLCCGPDIAIDESEPSAWTAVLDQVCGEIRTQLFSASGNGGHLDRAAGLARIQPPSDGANIVAVGACTSHTKDWKPAAYSSIGRGRRPGFVKPDFVAPGGDLPDDPFFVLGPAEGTAVPKQGTSLAAPNGTRIAASVQASLGGNITPLGVKALILNRADPSDHSQVDVGWGRIMTSPVYLTETKNNEVAVIYEGSLFQNQYREVSIPMPDGDLPGKVQISATFCVVTQTDPHHPLNYTRSGLEIVYRPNAEVFEEDEETGKKSQRPKARQFFGSRKMFQLEAALRKEAWKWESVMHRTRGAMWSSLLRPTFDVHYTTREGSESTDNARPLRYALVIRLRARGVPDLYNRVFRKYAGILVPMKPILELPVSV